MSQKMCPMLFMHAPAHQPRPIRGNVCSFSERTTFNVNLTCGCISIHVDPVWRGIMPLNTGGQMWWSLCAVSVLGIINTKQSEDWKYSKACGWWPADLSFSRPGDFWPAVQFPIDSSFCPPQPSHWKSIWVECRWLARPVARIPQFNQTFPMLKWNMAL